MSKREPSMHFDPRASQPCREFADLEADIRSNADLIHGLRQIIGRDNPIAELSVAELYELLSSVSTMTHQQLLERLHADMIMLLRRLSAK